MVSEDRSEGRKEGREGQREAQGQESRALREDGRGPTQEKDLGRVQTVSWEYAYGSWTRLTFDIKVF